MCPSFFMPTGFRTVGNTCAGIADRSLGGMGGSDVYVGPQKATGPVLELGLHFCPVLELGCGQPRCGTGQQKKDLVTIWGAFLVEVQC